MYSRPSTEVSVAPCARRKKTGVPPTPLKARTGLWTPPGVIRRARLKYSLDVSISCLGVISDPELLRIARAIGNDVLRAGAFEDVPGLEQSFFKLNQSLFGQDRESAIFTADLISANLKAGGFHNWTNQIQGSQAGFDH